MSTSPAVHCVLRAGGSGSRLWPLSTPEKPKQFLSFSGGPTFFEQTATHACAITGTKETIWTVTTQHYAPYIHTTYSHLLGTIIAEPASRGTGIADLHALLRIRAIDPDAIIVFMHTDAFIPPAHHDHYHHTIEHAINVAHTTHTLTLIGIEPTHVASQYGYVTYQQPLPNETPAALAVTAFIEKPSPTVAQLLINAGNSLWNTGVLVGSVASLYAFMHTHHSAILHAVQQYIAGHAAYDTLTSVSTEQLITPHTPLLRIIKGIYPWYDVGTMLMFLNLQKQYGNATTHIHQIDATNNLFYTHHAQTVCIGAHNLCVLEHDGTLFIVTQEHIDTFASHARETLAVHHRNTSDTSENIL